MFQENILKKKKKKKKEKKLNKKMQGKACWDKELGQLWMSQSVYHLQVTTATWPHILLTTTVLEVASQ